MLVDFVTYKEFYTSTLTTPSPSIPDKDVCTHFRNAGPKVIEAFLEFSKDKGGELFRATVGCMDGIWVHPGYMFCEMTGSTGNVGLKIGGCPLTSLTRLKAIMAMNKIGNKQMPNIEACIEDWNDVSARAI